MIRHSPCERYIRYLLLDSATRTNAEVRGLLEAQALDCLGDGYLNGLRQEYQVLPEGFDPRNRQHTSSFNLIRAAGVLDLFQGDPVEMAPVYTILDTPRAKEFIEAAIIWEAPSQIIAHQLQRRFGVAAITPTAVERYKWFFWDVHLLDTIELKGIIKLRYMRLKESANTEASLHGKALTSALYSDIRWIAANTPKSPFSAMFGLIHLGIVPPAFDANRVLAQAQQNISLRVLQESYSLFPDADRRLLNWTTSYKILAELAEDRANPEDDLRAQLEAITLRSDTQPMPHVLAISNGQHTVDLMAPPTESKEPHE